MEDSLEKRRLIDGCHQLPHPSHPHCSPFKTLTWFSRVSFTTFPSPLVEWITCQATGITYFSWHLIFSLKRALKASLSPWLLILDISCESVVDMNENPAGGARTSSGWIFMESFTAHLELWLAWTSVSTSSEKINIRRNRTNNLNRKKIVEKRIALNAETNIIWKRVHHS